MATSKRKKGPNCRPKTQSVGPHKKRVLTKNGYKTITVAKYKRSKRSK